MNIRAIRKQQKITQDRLAKMARIDRSFLIGIERGERNCTVDIVQKIAESLDVPMGLLFFDPEEREAYEYYLASLKG